MIRRVILLFIGLFCVALAEENTPTGKTYELFLHAEYERLNENYPIALSKYKSVLRKYKKSSTLHKTIAEIYFHQGKNTKALHHLNASFDLNKNDIQTGIMLFQFTLTQGDTLVAETILDSLLYYNPEEIELLYYQAELQFNQLDWNGLIFTYKDLFIKDNSNTELLQKIIEIGKALDDFIILKRVLEEILKHDADNYLVLQALAQYYYSNGDLETAVSYFVEMIPLAKDKMAIMLAVSDIYLRINQPKHALSYLKQIFDIENPSFDVLHLLLIAYTATDNTIEQIVIGKKMVDLFPEKQTGFETLAYAYLEDKKYVKALNILDDAVNRFPNKSLFPYLIGSIHNIHKSYNDAKQYFMNALNLSPESRTIRYALATVSEELFEFSTTDSLFEMIINTDENDAGALNDYAYILSERSIVTKDKMVYALGLANRAFEQSPENPAILDTMGWIYFQLENYSKASNYIQKSIELDSENTVILEHYGDIQVKLGNFSVAKKMYKKALEIDSNNLILHHKIEQLNDE